MGTEWTDQKRTARAQRVRESPETLNLIGELNCPEGTLRVLSTQASKEGEGGVQVAPNQ